MRLESRCIVNIPIIIEHISIFDDNIFSPSLSLACDFTSVLLSHKECKNFHIFFVASFNLFDIKMASLMWILDFSC